MRTTIKIQESMAFSRNKSKIIGQQDFKERFEMDRVNEVKAKLCGRSSTFKVSIQR